MNTPLSNINFQRFIKMILSPKILLDKTVGYS